MHGMRCVWWVCDDDRLAATNPLMYQQYAAQLQAQQQQMLQYQQYLQYQ